MTPRPHAPWNALSSQREAAVADRKPWEANGPGQHLIGWMLVAVALLLQLPEILRRRGPHGRL